MTAEQRRDELLKLLQMDIKPMSASNLGERFGVSRQIIVGDVALLRAAGADILATPRGYVMNTQPDEDDTNTYAVMCRHNAAQLHDELYTIVDHGAAVLNVAIEHPLYGTITLPLNIQSRFDADDYLAKVGETDAPLISTLTGGVHMHTIRCADPEAYRRILIDLREKGVLHTD